MSRTAPRFTDDEMQKMRLLTFRGAAQQFGVGYTVWRRIKDDPAFLPARRVRDDRATAELVARTLASVKEAPHLNTQVRAARLGCRVQACQEVLKLHGLSRLHARLRYAGYQVEVVRPLQVARFRRIVASGPGAITYLDYKTFGFLRGCGKQAGRRIGGYVAVDNLTAFGIVRLCTAPSGPEAVEALKKYLAAAPFEPYGVVLTDNGKDFLSNDFIRFVLQSRLHQRTTRGAHPWSNGKVEALNKTLKYQCFPALAAADVRDWGTLVDLVDRWMDYYNQIRAHSGANNRGLPPLALYDLWKRTPGTHPEKLVKLGIVSPTGEWRIRAMGAGPGSAGEQPGGSGEGRHALADKRGVPLAYVLDRMSVRGVSMADETERGGPVQRREASASLDQKTHSLILQG